MSELCRSRRSEGYGVCDDVEAEVYTAPVPPQRRSFVLRHLLPKRIQ